MMLMTMKRLKVTLGVGSRHQQVHQPSSHSYPLLPRPEKVAMVTAKYIPLIASANYALNRLNMSSAFNRAATQRQFT